MCERFIENFVEKVIEKTKNPLKLYHVKRPDELPPDYANYTEFLVVAYSEEEARNTHPHPNAFYGNKVLSLEEQKIKGYQYGWVAKEDLNKLIVIEIGTASKNVKEGVVISSYPHG